MLIGPAFYKNPNRSPFWGELLTRCVEETDIRTQTQSEDYIFHLVRENETFPQDCPLFQQVRSGEIQGVLALGVNLPGYSEGIYDIVPVIHFASGGPWTVTIDYSRIEFLGVEALRDAGCQRIGLWRPIGITWFDSDAAASWRHDVINARQSFQAALTVYGLPYNDALVEDNLELFLAGDTTPPPTAQEQGYQTAMRVFGPQSPSQERPDGLLITDDTMTTGAMAAFRELKIEVGVDVHIATHSNVGSILLFGYEKSLSLIEVDPSEIVRTLFGAMDERRNAAHPGVRVFTVPPHRRS